MKNEIICDEESCVATKPFARENYYFGKLLTAEALQSEQHYLNEKRWIINRYGIGWGVLCGLKVIPDCNNPCKVLIEPGLAIDKYGNEIIVCDAVSIDLKVCQEEQAQGDDAPRNSNSKVYITIRYKECLTHPSPVPTDDCCSLEEKYNYNRSKETFQISASCTEPDKPKTIREEYAEVLDCDSDCVSFLDNPAPVVVNKCNPRRKWCEITLACICYIEDKNVQEHQIDNDSYRKLAFSNEMLYAMIRCLTDEVRQSKASHHDRRQHIPLLANTIKGLLYQDGKVARIDAGKHPFRVTTDGEAIWITDMESPKLIRINRKYNKLIEDKLVDLSCCDESIESSWGIAYDGKYMWITHNNDGGGKLTRVNSCNTDDCWSFSALPNCTDPEECQQYCIERSSNNVDSIPDYPQEVVYHQNLLYISHGWATETGSDTIQSQNDHQDSNERLPEGPTYLLISIIDTEHCCLVKTISIHLDDYCILINPITSMVSDGEALWITYAARFHHYKQQHNRPVVQKIKYDPLTNECEIGDPYIVDKGQRPGKLAFDGTHLWLTHDDGASKIEISTGEVVDHIETGQTQVAIAYGGGDNIWTAEYNNDEARLNRTDIHSVDRNGEIEFVSDIPEYVITDAQYDGVFIYVSALSDSGKDHHQGIIHRILP